MRNNDNDKEYIDEVIWEDYESGDTVEGILVDSLSNMGKYGNNIYKIRTENEFIAIWGSKDLNDKMNKLKVSVGMKIAITYNGLKRTSNGFDMKDFTVVVLD